MKSPLQTIALGLSVIMGMGGVAGLVGAFYILPYRVEAVERQVGNLRLQRDADRELLTRIEERLIAVQRALERKP